LYSFQTIVKGNRQLFKIDCPSPEGHSGRIVPFSLNEHRCGPVLREYRELNPLYTTKFVIPLGSVKSKCYQTRLFASFGKLERVVKFSGVKPVDANVWTSILKMDARPNTSIDPLVFRRALARSWTKLCFALTQPLNFVPEFVLTTSASFPFTTMGFRTKESVFSDINFYDILESPASHDCVWRVSPKEELKLLTEIDSNKIRTFIIPPLHLLWWQKVFFSNQDQFLKKGVFGDIRYGQVFAYGGFHRLMERHRGRLVCYGDVSGWDRLLSIMKNIYDLRSKGIDTQSLEEIYSWTVTNTVNSILLLPNGDVVEKEWGNNSGSGTTTGDNCIGHQIINDYKRELLPKGSDYISDVYGDDFLSSVSGMDRGLLLDLETRVYSTFGLALKFLHVIDGPVGAQFLGATCVQYDNCYLPSYDSDRIYASLVISNSRHGYDDEISKYYALMHLAWNDRPLFDEIYRILISGVADTTCNGPMLEFIREHGLPTWEQVVYGFWMGSESYSIPEVDGFKNYLSSINVI